MKLSDIMGNAGLSIWAEVAFVIFLATFLGIVMYTFSRKRTETFDKIRQIPLHEDEVMIPRTDVPSENGGGA